MSQRDDKLLGADTRVSTAIQQLSMQTLCFTVNANMPVLSWLDPDFVQFLFEANQFTITQTVEFLEASYPTQKGLSVRNLKRFMCDNDIQLRKQLTNDDLRKEMEIATAEVGGVVGRKKMQGYMRTKGV